MAFLFTNLWWMIPVAIILYTSYIAYRFIVDVGHTNKFSFLLISLPLRLFVSLFKGLIMSLVVTFYGFITLMFIAVPIHLITRWAPLKDLCVFLTLVMIFAPFFYYFIKIFKEELELYKTLHISER